MKLRKWRYKMPVFQLYYNSKEQKDILDAVKQYAKSEDISISQAIIDIIAVIFYQIEKDKKK